MNSSLAIKLMLPVSFFGYAVFANVMLMTSDVDRPDIDGVLKGEFTQEVDTLYRANLPHREPAVGIVGAARYALLNEGRDGVVAGDKGWLFTKEEYRPLDPDAQLTSDALDWIASVDAQLAQMGSALVVVPVPAKVDVDRAYAGASDTAGESAAAYAWFMAALAQRDIVTVDSRPALLDTPDAFFQTDTHWTDLGASATADVIAASGVIAPGDTAFAREEQTPVTFIGDLVSFVTSDGLAPSVGLAPETVTPYLAQPAADDLSGGGLDLFGNSGPVPLVLVGTSYSANENWSFVEALKLSLEHDVLNYAREGMGPVAPMDLFLDQIDRDAPPPVVIWEFPVRYLTDPTLLDGVVETEGAGDV